MTNRSLSRCEINRRNARSSTGPITRSGKLRVRRNAFKHGLAAGALAQNFPRHRIETIAQVLGASSPQSQSAAIQFAEAHLYWVKVTKVIRQVLKRRVQELTKDNGVTRRAAEAIALVDPELIRLERYEKRALRSRLKMAQAFNGRHKEAS